jgi:hypothetical protein
MDTLFYARRVDQAPVESLDALKEYDSASREFPFRLTCRDSAAGFFDLAVFRILGEQFYLYWHASYKIRRLVCGEASLRRLRRHGAFGEIPESVSTRLRGADLRPRITFSERFVSVGLVWFSPWKGFVYEEADFARQQPHRLLAARERVLAEYYCGFTL